MKTKCPACLTTKGKRDCLLHEKALICPRCCAQIRTSETCQECPHFVKAEQDRIKKMISNGTIFELIEMPPGVEDEVDRALDFLEQGQNSTAEEIITPLSEKHPDNYLVHYAQGCLEAMHHHYQASVDHLKKAVELFPYFSQAWYNLAESYKQVGDAAKAVLAAQKAVEFGKLHDAHVVKAREFLNDFRKFLKKGKNITIEQFLINAREFDLAFAEMTEGSLESAIARFEKVLLTDPDHEQSHGNLALCHAQLGNRELALHHINQALELNPDYEVASSNRPKIAALKEGEKLTGIMQTVNYAATGMKPVE